MICNKCGAELPDGSAFCPNCGADLSVPAAPAAEPATQYVPMNEQPQYQPQPQAQYQPQVQVQEQYQPQPQPQYGDPNGAMFPQPAPKKKTGLIIGIIAGGVAVIVAVVLCILLLGGNSPESVAKKAVQAVLDGDANAAIDCMNEDYLEAVCREEGVTMSELKEELKDDLSYATSYIEGYGVECSVKDTSVSASSDAASIISEFAQYGISVSEVKTVTVNVEMTVLGQTMTQPIPVDVAKIDGTWYIVSADGIL